MLTMPAVADPRPAYYRMHASGVEPIQLTRYMNHNVGNAWEALARAHFASDLCGDLAKAHWYLRDELAHGEPLPRMFSDAVWATFCRFVAQEEDERERYIFNALWEYQAHGSLPALRRAEKLLACLIEATCAH